MSYLKIDKTKLSNLDYVLSKEVIQTNLQGTYSYSTIADINTRKYHGLLVAPQPHLDQDQHVFLASLEEEIVIDKMPYYLGSHQYPGVERPVGFEYIDQITVDPIAKIQYKSDDFVLTKEKLLLKTEDRLLLKYTLLATNANTILRLRPFLAFRNKHHLSRNNFYCNPDYWKAEGGVKFKLYDQYDDLFLQLSVDSIFISKIHWYYNIEYLREKERGYNYQEDQLVPGYFEVALSEGESIIFSAGLSEANQTNLQKKFAIEAEKKKPLRNMTDCLKYAAEQFVIKQEGKTEVVAGYPWFGRWGRDTFIALPGLTLSHGNAGTCKAVIDTMVTELKGPLFPNTGYGASAVMNSADAPLWFFWTLQMYANYTDTLSDTWKQYSSKMKGILEGFRAGTQFNIKMQENCLIYAGEKGKALTWMDAVYEGEVFTSRIGLPVDINALWYNAICFSVAAADLGGDQCFVEEWRPYIKKIEASFINTFWDDQKGYLADYVYKDHIDWSIRPNQIFATSLPYTPLNNEQCKHILKIVQRELLTPYGIRSLSTNNKKYIGVYQGDQKSRDQAYHQGTVWPWLLGHFSDGYLKAYGPEGISFIKSIYTGFEDTLQEHGLGTVSEIYDGNYPHHPRGAIAQAWSVAELLRISEMIKKYEIGRDYYQAPYTSNASL